MHNNNNPTPFSQLIADFRGKNLPDEQIEADYNNTINYPNNYFFVIDTKIYLRINFFK